MSSPRRPASLCEPFFRLFLWVLCRVSRRPPSVACVVDGCVVLCWTPLLAVLLICVVHVSQFECACPGLLPHRRVHATVPWHVPSKYNNPNLVYFCGLPVTERSHTTKASH